MGRSRRIEDSESEEEEEEEQLEYTDQSEDEQQVICVRLIKKSGKSDNN